MKKKLLLVALTCLFLKVNAQTEFLVQAPNSDSIELYLEKLNIPALGIGIIEKGQLKQANVYGELQEGKAAEDDAIFDVASLAKSITTLLTLKLVSDDKWDLDAPLYEYWVDPDVKDDPLHKKLTTRHVLAHRTGFLNWRWMHESKKLTFDFEPGTKFGYSGEGFEYLRKALESKFDLPFNDLCKKYVFKDYQMASSQFSWNDQINSEKFAFAHNQKGEKYDFTYPEEVNAADDLMTTVKDLGNLCSNILQKKGLTDEVFQEMVSLQSDVKPGFGFSLGWILINDLPNEEYALMNAGSDKGVNAIILLLPKSERALVLTTNGDNGRALIFKQVMELLDVGGDIVSRLGMG